MLGLADGAVTVWRRVGAGFDRHVLRQVRTECTDYAEYGAVQPLAKGSAQGDGVAAWVPGDPDVAVGDYLSPGEVPGDEPPEGALRVASVERLTLRGRAHHAEVRAR